MQTTSANQSQVKIIFHFQSVIRVLYTSLFFFSIWPDSLVFSLGLLQGLEFIFVSMSSSVRIDRHKDFVGFPTSLFTQIPTSTVRLEF